MKKIEIKDRFGNIIGSFRYDPSCPNTYLNRGKLAHDTLDRASIAEVVKTSIYTDGTPVSPDYAPIIEKAELAIFRWFDILLGYTGAGRDVFRNTRPFASTVDGDFVCGFVMESVLRETAQIS